MKVPDSAAAAGRSISRGRRVRWLLHRMRRGWRLVCRICRRRRVRFIFHADYSLSIAGVPMDPVRAERILAVLTEEGFVIDADIVPPRRASMNHLLLVHTPEYLDSVQRPQGLMDVLGFPVDERQREQFIDFQRRMTGGTIQATRFALISGGIGVNLGGGFHHALPARGMGFCVFNDIAVAIARLRAHGFRAPVLVIDLDLHDGNGTREIFAADPSVYTYSVHNANWGDTNAVASTSIELGEDVTDEVYLGTLLKTLPEIIEEVKPGLVMYVAGCDIARDDQLGNWKISADGVLARDRFIIQIVREQDHKIPLAIVLGGGYGPRSWQYSARFFFWLMTGKTKAIPDSDELALMRVRRIWRQLNPSELTSEPGGFSLRLTDEDLADIMPGARSQTRFLDYFSRHGVELLMEKLGIFAQLRTLGFHNPLLEIDLTHPLGSTLRVWSDWRRAELLIELRARRSQADIPGMEVLALEWLLLQNPRARFTGERPPLPGQKYPGLGMLSDVLGWLVSICQMMHLDGVTYVPSHYHVAAQSRKLVRFLQPEDEAHFRALGETLAGIPLHVATKKIEDGEVLDVQTGRPVRWEGRRMVLPVSERLRHLVFSPEYEARVSEALENLEYRIVAPPASGRPGGRHKGEMERDV
ncbi:MAG: histone deacetylase [Acidobacteria bacterium]|nr:histone deacetylase [Acidobacteriota bacterium]